MGEYERLLDEPPSSLDSNGDRHHHSGGANGEKIEFTWFRTRHCFGTRLHEAVLEGDVEKTKTLLDENPALLHARFTYTTVYGKETQEGSGQAIHLAASRCNQKVTEVLLERKATLDSCVTRAGLDHYDVLHAAVFAEGYGGTPEYVKYLVDAGAPLTKNQDRQWALHKAYQGGWPELIKILAEAMKEQGLLEAAESIDRPKDGIEKQVETPLQLGVNQRKLSEEQLAFIASPTMASFRIFLDEAPRCLPRFIERLRLEHLQEKSESEADVAQQFADVVQSQHIVRFLEEAPEAADVILNAMLAEPQMDNPGFHALPTRCGFGPIDKLEQLRDLVNPTHLLVAEYRPDTRWRYDDVNFKGEEWHEELLARSEKKTPPNRDTNTKVCFVADLINAELFTALKDSQAEDIFQNDVILGLQHKVWWSGAVKLDIINFMISTWALLLLIYDSLFPSYFDPDYGMDRQLKAKGHYDTQDQETHAALRKFSWDSAVSNDFMIARGICDFLFEIIQLIGLIMIGHPMRYLTLGNLLDLVRAFLPQILWFYPDFRAFRVFVIFFYWERILEVNMSETLMMELLPLTRIAKTLVPALVVAFVGFCAFTHALFILETEAEELWPRTVWSSFSMLITAELPDPSVDDIRLKFSYLAVIVFAVFFLNIFIGVIGDSYIREKERSRQTFQEVRAGLNATFLLRSKVLPCNLCYKWTAMVWLVVAMAVAMILQAKTIFGRCPTNSAAVPVYAACQLVMLLAGYQDPDAAWNPRRRNRDKHYLWITVPVDEKTSNQMDDIEKELRSVRELLERFGVIPSDCGVSSQPKYETRATSSIVLSSMRLARAGSHSRLR